MKSKFKFTIISWAIFIILIGYSALGAYLKSIGNKAFYFFPIVFYLGPISTLMGAVAFFVTSRDIKKSTLWHDESYKNSADILSAICHGFSVWFLIKGIYFVLALFVIPRGQIHFMNILAPLGAFVVYLIGWLKTSPNKYKLIGLIAFFVFLIMFIESLIKYYF